MDWTHSLINFFTFSSRSRILVLFQSHWGCPSVDEVWSTSLRLTIFVLYYIHAICSEYLWLLNFYGTCTKEESAIDFVKTDETYAKVFKFLMKSRRIKKGNILLYTSADGKQKFIKLQYNLIALPANSPDLALIEISCLQTWSDIPAKRVSNLEIKSLLKQRLVLWISTNIFAKDKEIGKRWTQFGELKGMEKLNFSFTDHVPNLTLQNLVLIFKWKV